MVNNETYVGIKFYKVQRYGTFYTAFDVYDIIQQG